MDIADISHVINLSVPESPEVYLHRAGRTGRAGKDGIVVSIATVGELTRLMEIAKKLKIELEPPKRPSGRSNAGAKRTGKPTGKPAATNKPKTTPKGGGRRP